MYWLNELVTIFIVITKLSLRIGIIFSLIFYCINESFVKLWVGEENYGGELLTFTFVIWILIECYLRGSTAIIYASGKINKLTIYSILEAVFNIVITIYLINTIIFSFWIISSIYFAGICFDRSIKKN